MFLPHDIAIVRPITKLGVSPKQGAFPTTLSHACSALSNPPGMSGIADAAAADIRREVLERLAAAGAGCGLAEVGMPVFDSVAAAGREMLRNLIEARDVAAPRLVRDDKPWHRAGATRKTIMTLLGEAGHVRSRFRRRDETMSWMPVDEGLGLTGAGRRGRRRRRRRRRRPAAPARMRNSCCGRPAR